LREIRPVIPRFAKDLCGRLARSFAKRGMTDLLSNCLHNKA
jgi:hypothetical protein